MLPSEVRLAGRVVVEHQNGERRELEATTLANGNVMVRWPLAGIYTFSGRDGSCLDQGMRSWKLADVGAVPVRSEGRKVRC